MNSSSRLDVSAEYWPDGPVRELPLKPLDEALRKAFLDRLIRFLEILRQPTGQKTLLGLLFFHWWRNHASLIPRSQCCDGSTKRHEGLHKRHNRKCPVGWHVHREPPDEWADTHWWRNHAS